MEKLVSLFERLVVALEKMAAGGKPAAAPAAGGTASSAPAAAPKPATKTTTKTAYTPVHSKAEAQAMATQVKETCGVDEARALVKGLGFEKMADIAKPEDFDRLYDAAKKILVDGGHLTEEDSAGGGEEY